MVSDIVLFEIHSSNTFVSRGHNKRFLVKDETVSFARDVVGIRDPKPSPGHDNKEGTPEPPRIKLPFARVTSSEKHLPRYPGQGYVIGSDPHKCDILVGRRAGGVSGKHFSIHLHERPGVLKLNDLSSHGTSVRQPNDEHPNPKRMKEEITLERGNHNRPGTMSIHLPGVQMELRVPSTTFDQKGFEAAWSNLYRMCQDDASYFSSLKLAPPSSTQAPVSDYILKERISNCDTGGIFIAERRIKQRGRPAELFTVKRWKALRAAKFEVHMLSRIQHAHIVRFIDYVAPLENREDAEVIMEHMRGRSLFQEHTYHPFTVLELKRVAHQLANVLNHIHQELGFVHGDISLETVWLKSRQPIHARLFGFKDVTHGCFNSTSLSAPEIRDGKKYTSKADIWSLGITLMEIFFGLPRNSGGDDVSYYDLMSHLAISGQHYESGRRFLFNLLDKDPNKRIEGQGLLNDQFFKTKEGDGNLVLPIIGPREAHFGGRQSEDETWSIPDTAIPDTATSDDEDEHSI